MREKIIFEPEIEAMYEQFLRTNSLELSVLGDDVYARRVKMPKWNIQPTCLQEPKIAVRYNTSWGFSTSKSANRQRAEYFMALAMKLEEEISDVIDAASQLYGDHGPLISGIYRGHFPNDVKDRLRFLNQAKNLANDASRLHAQLSKTRSPLFS